VNEEIIKTIHFISNCILLHCALAHGEQYPN